MNPKRLAELRELCEKATPGKWNAYDWPGFPRPDETENGCVRIESELQIAAFCFSGNKITGEPNYDALFIASARTALPECLDEIARLQAERAADLTLMAAQQDEIERLRTALKTATLMLSTFDEIGLARLGPILDICAKALGVK